MHLQYLDQVIGKRAGVNTYACMNGLMLPERQVFMVDTHVNYDPSAEQLAEITDHGGRRNDAFWHSAQSRLAVAFQLRQQQPAQRPQDARDAGLAAGPKRPGWRWTAKCMVTWRWTAKARAALMPNSTLAGDANLLVLPNIDAANIAYNLLKTQPVAILPLARCCWVRPNRCIF